MPNLSEKPAKAPAQNEVPGTGDPAPVNARPGYATASTGATHGPVAGASAANDAHATSVSSPLMDVDIPTGLATLDAAGHLLTCNPAFARLLGLADVTPGAGLLDLLGRLGTRTLNALESALSEASATRVMLAGKRGDRPVRLHVTAHDNAQRLLVAEPAASAVPCVDTEPSFIDSLTGMGNRRALERCLAQVADCTNGQACALLMLDLDRFKAVNDRLGHGTGDNLLKLVAKRVRRAARADDVIVRLGGDEFVVVHRFVDQSSGTERVAQRLVEMISRPFLIDGQQVNIGASVGIASIDQGTDRVEDLLRHADLALYDAKAAGRGTSRFFNRVLEQRAQERRLLELSLRRASSPKEFRLEYQPQLELPAGLECKKTIMSDTRAHPE